MLADLKEFLRAAKTFMETKHRLLAALLDGNPEALDHADTLRQQQAKFEMFCRVNAVAVLLSPGGCLTCPACKAAGRDMSLLAKVELRPETLKFWSALFNGHLEMHFLVGKCEECGTLVVTSDELTICRLFCGFAGDRWWFINKDNEDPLVVKDWANKTL